MADYNVLMPYLQARQNRQSRKMQLLQNIVAQRQAQRDRLKIAQYQAFIDSQRDAAKREYEQPYKDVNSAYQQARIAQINQNIAQPRLTPEEKMLLELENRKKLLAYEYGLRQAAQVEKEKRDAENPDKKKPMTIAEYKLLLRALDPNYGAAVDEARMTQEMLDTARSRPPLTQKEMPSYEQRLDSLTQRKIDQLGGLDSMRAVNYGKISGLVPMQIDPIDAWLDEQDISDIYRGLKYPVEE